MRPTALAAVIPCRNEEPSIAQVLADLARIGIARVVIGLDPASTDATEQLARDAGATIARSATSGYDGPCLAALAALRHDSFGGHVLFLDAGNKYVMDTVAVFLDGLDPAADLTFGIRDSQNYWHQQAGNNLFKVILYARFRTWVYDVSSLRVAKMSALEELRLEDRQFSLPFQTIVHALTLHKNIQYAPIRCTPSRTGTSKVSGQWRNTAKAAGRMLTSLVRVPKF